MPRVSKSKSTVEPTVESVVENIAASVVVPEKKVRAKKAKVETTLTTVETVDLTANTVITVDVTDTIESSIIEQSTEFNAKLQQLGSLISGLKTEYRNLEKKWQRELKAAQKQCSRRKRKSGNRAPSGFVKPTRISDELASFLGKEKGTEMARTSVTRDINAYIRSNNLQDKENGRQINPDTKLATLLKLEKSDVLTYFNLQRYMSPHFAKTVKADTVAPVV
jgi:chromatin remodeling complex protein RSC6